MKRRSLVCYDGPLEGLYVELHGADWKNGDLIEVKRQGERWRKEGQHWTRPEVTYVYRVIGDCAGVLQELHYVG